MEPTLYIAHDGNPLSGKQVKAVHVVWTVQQEVIETASSHLSTIIKQPSAFRASLGSRYQRGIYHVLSCSSSVCGTCSTSLWSHSWTVCVLRTGPFSNFLCSIPNLWTAAAFEILAGGLVLSGNDMVTKLCSMDISTDLAHKTFHPQ